MSIDWIVVGSVVAVVAACVAAITFLWEVRSAKRSLQTQAILSLMDMFNELRPARRECAVKLLNGELPNYALFDVLDLLSTVAGLVEDHAINRRIAYREFSWWIIRYWLAARDAIAEDHRIDPDSYGTIERVAKRLMTMEMKSGYTPEYYSGEVLRRFLLQEARLDRNEAQMSDVAPVASDAHAV